MQKDSNRPSWMMLVDKRGENWLDECQEIIESRYKQKTESKRRFKEGVIRN
jgi:hypothetical protein